MGRMPFPAAAGAGEEATGGSDRIWPFPCAFFLPYGRIGTDRRTVFPPFSSYRRAVPESRTVFRKTAETF